MASHSVLWNEEYPRAARGGAAAIGNFDGVHLGHAALAARAADQARALGGPAVVVTFDPHPLTLLRPEQPMPLLTPPEERGELLHRAGADHVVTIRTTDELLGLRAAGFFEEVVRHRLAARALVEGPNFHFGRGREGNLELLRHLCAGAGIDLFVVEPVRIDGVEVSSSRVRAALAAGDVATAARLLGRPYRARGIVGTGRRMGRTIGFPTANLEGVTTVIPADGVYAARVPGLDGRDWPAAVNVGPAPTFGVQARTVEAHLIGYAGDLYGRTLAVEFVERLRDVRPFAGTAELAEQLGRDVERARDILTR